MTAGPAGHDGVTAVLFDLGGVVFDSPMDAFAAYEQRAGLPAGLIRRLNSTNPDTNAWARFERGELDKAGFVDVFEAEARDAGYEVDAREVLTGLSGSVRPAMVAALHRLRAEGYRLAAVTNNVVPMAQSSAAHRELLGLFDVVVESSVERVRKPEPAFYELALSRLGDVDPRRVAYLDDLGINLKPARAMGMTTIKVLSAEQALTDLGGVLSLDLLPSGQDSPSGRLTA